jgi:hypothetical protein
MIGKRERLRFADCFVSTCSSIAASFFLFLFPPRSYLGFHSFAHPSSNLSLPYRTEKPRTKQLFPAPLP